MKNVIIVTKGNNAVGAGDNNMAVIKKTEVGSVFLAGLDIVMEVMNSIPEEWSETTHIYLPDTLKAIVSGGAIEYVKTGKTAQGKELSAKEREAFTQFYSLYAKKMMNVMFGLYKYIKKDDAQLQAIKTSAWNALNAMPVANAVPQTQTITKTIEVDPDKKIREMLDKKMEEAIESGDFDTYDKLAERKAKLRDIEYKTVTETVAVTGVVVNSSNSIADNATSVNFEEEDGQTGPFNFNEQGSASELNQADNTTESGESKTADSELTQPW